MQLAFYCSAEVLKLVRHEYNLHKDGEENNAGMLKFCKIFYLKYQNQDMNSPEDYVLGHDVKLWDKAALETLSEVKNDGGGTSI